MAQSLLCFVAHVACIVIKCTNNRKSMQIVFSVCACSIILSNPNIWCALLCMYSITSMARTQMA